MRRPARFSSRGVTLVEALTVITVLSILAVVALPSFENLLDKRRVSGAGTLLMSDLQNARSEAVMRNASVAVTFSSSGYTLSTGGSTIRSVTLGNGNSITFGASTVIYYDPRQGIASSPGTSRVRLSNGSNTLQFMVNQMGRVQCSVISGDASC